MDRRSIGFAVAAFVGLLLAVAATPSSLRAATLAAGNAHSCVIVDGGAVKCWGHNSAGELGNGTTADSAAAVSAVGVVGAAAIAAGSRHTCVIVEDERVKCWGHNLYGQLGDGTTQNALTAGDVIGVNGASAIAADRYDTCAIVAGGALKCWGLHYRQPEGGSRPVDIPGVIGAIAVTVGDAHACAIVAGGAMKCWGQNNEGQLGDGSRRSTSVSVDVVSMSSAIALAAGVSHTCAALAGGQVKCWGYYDDDSDYFRNLQPTLVDGLSGVTALAAAQMSTCALVAGGAVKCWGDNSEGKLGNGTLVGSLQPVTVGGITAATQLAVAYHHACAQTVNGAVQCWGDSSFFTYSQLGNGRRSGTSGLVTVVGLDTLVAVGAGLDHTCATTSSGGVHCWGANSSGQLGNGGTRDQLVPGKVQLGANAIRVSSGERHSCALVEGGHVKCWGSNDVGQLGDGTRQDSPLPIEVVGVADARAIAVGLESCAILTDGSVKCWGLESTTVAAVDAQASAVAAGDEHVCIVHGDGGVSCWGSGRWGQLGTYDWCGVVARQRWPVRVPGVEGATALAAGRLHTCAVVAGGAVKCWGQNWHGALGNGSTLASCVPVDVVDVTGASAVAVGHDFSCAVVASGTVKCWGDNFHGQLGSDAAIGWSSVAVDVPGIIGAIALAAGDHHACAILGDGKLRCWGSKGRGQLGNGSIAVYTTPQKVVGSPFPMDTSLFAFADDAATSDGSTLPFTVQVGQPVAEASGSLRLQVMPSPTLVDPTWRCVAFGGALCPTLPPVGGALDLALELPPGSDLQFRLMATADVSRGAFAEVTTRLESATAADGMLTSTVTTLPIAPDGVFKGGFEATGQ